MKLLRLELTGIGPFTSRSEIDFARLGDTGLFLLEGPTGAGKSTVIDAISFALYGRVAGSQTDADRLRSHFAGPDDESAVDLVFRTQAGRYRIRRTPKYQRAKRRGDGVRTINSTVALWRLSDTDDLFSDDLSEGQLLSNRIDEVGDEVLRIVGLSHAQFVQTVVLPQGEFASFLRATTDDKRTLLQKLFGTDLLARVQGRLIEGRQAAEHDRAQAGLTLKRAVHAFAGAAGLDDAPHASDPSSAESAPPSAGADLSSAVLDEAAAAFDHAGADPALLLDLTDRVIRRLEATAANAQQAEQSARTDQLAALAASQHARQVMARRERRRNLETRLSLLRAGEADEAALNGEIAAAERAAPIAGVREVFEQAHQRHETAWSVEEVRRARLPVQYRMAEELVLRSVADDLRRQAGALSEQLERETELLALRTRNRSLNAESADLTQAVTELAGRLTVIAAEHAVVLSLRDRAVQEAADLAAAEASFEQLRVAARSAEQAAAAAVEVDHSEQRAAQALTAERRMGEDLHLLRRRRLDGIAAELGQTLVDGEPCLVCGSCDHPAPAAPAADHVTEGMLADAEAALSSCQTTTTAAREALAAARVRWSELNAMAGGLTAADAPAVLTAAATRLDTSRSAAAAVLDHDAQLRELDAERADLVLREQQDRSRLEVLADQLQRCAQDIATIDQQLVTARAGFGSVAERLVDLDGQATMLASAIEAVGIASGTATAADHARSAFEKTLAEAGFDSDAAYLAAYRDAPALEALRRRNGELREEWATVTDGLTDPELAIPEVADGWQNGAPADQSQLAELLTVLEKADSRYAEAAAAFGSSRDRLTDATELAGRIAAAVTESTRLFVATAPAIRLGHLVAGLGDNQLRMDLSTYVLVTRFEQVVAAANDQLRRISSGRYELEHSDAKQGNARSGLGLRVHDLRTDRSRDPATLSGGETFYVSLSLALGLADVVRAESGGIDLGTLFVDEGFGSLDSEVLDEVLSVLDGLRADGRAVGVVSHVGELKARIADRVEVRPNADGSSRLRVLS